MISSGNKDFDAQIGGYRNELTVIYGPGASGKTTLSVLAAIGQLDREKKVVFLDTESGFSIERFMQISGPNYISYLDKLLVLKISSFEEQCKRIDQLMNFIIIDLIIIDSLGAYYRKEVKNNPNETNRKMERQLKVLTEIARKNIPVIVTNQVYTDPVNGEIRMVGGDMVKKWARCLIELKKEPRRIIIRRPEERIINFEIVNEGIKTLL